MKRSGFQRPPYERPARIFGTITRSYIIGPTAMREPVEKQDAQQNTAYMNIVRAMRCAHCGRAPRSQFCHTDLGKGQGIKTDCRLGWPGCGDDPATGRVGCHTIIGRQLPRELRRTLEARYARETRDDIRARRLWPDGLAEWVET